MMLRAVIGMVMMIAGGLLSGVGKAGLAGLAGLAASGITLDTEQARRDVEPWSRMAGGALKDAMDEAGIRGGNKPPDETLAFDERLRRLKQLRDEGVVSEQEYESTKKKILESA
jgi:3-oxoacyl-(acyl-carrier-protein) synthase